MKQRIYLFFLLILLFTRIIAQEDQTPTPQWRPVYHFTPLKNWTNDPNGPIYLDGIYHLYNQQNPYENKWGHMSWGHATSTDLVHWKHLPIAMMETIDKDTTWRFSGCAVWDKNNMSGFCKGGGCLVAIYTAHQPNLKKESQYIAYSNDGGMTLTNYPGNPVIDLHKKDFRDPNVSWNEELKKWVMVVALPSDHKVRFYASDNLKEWKLLSEFGPAGYTHANWECPSLMQLPVEGQSNKRKWVLMVSAAGREKGVFMQYFVGDFNGGEFKNSDPGDSVLTVDYGDCFYAAIPWNNIPDDKKILIGWMVPFSKATYPWRGQMSIPRDLGLKETKNGIRLVQNPTSLIKDNLAKFSNNAVIGMTGVEINNNEVPIDKQHIITGNTYWLEAELVVGPGASGGFRIAQEKDGTGKTVMETEIGYDVMKNQLYIDRRLAGDDKIRKENVRKTIDLQNQTSTIRMEILLDKSSLEVFFNGGEKVYTTYIFPDKGADGLSAFATGGTVTIKSLKIWDLSSVKSNE
jgi:levanase/fructan beta-fructosidase